MCLLSQQLLSRQQYACHNKTLCCCDKCDCRDKYLSQQSFVVTNIILVELMWWLRCDVLYIPQYFTSSHISSTAHYSTFPILSLVRQSMSFIATKVCSCATKLQAYFCRNKRNFGGMLWWGKMVIHSTSHHQYFTSNHISGIAHHTTSHIIPHHTTYSVQYHQITHHMAWCG